MSSSALQVRPPALTAWDDHLHHATVGPRAGAPRGEERQQEGGISIPQPLPSPALTQPAASLPVRGGGLVLLAGGQEDARPPLALGTGTRRRLACAVAFLLEQSQLAGLSDTARGLVVMALAKANAGKGWATSTRAGDLASWMGVGISSVDKALASLRPSGIVVTHPRIDGTGVVGLDLTLPLLAHARGPAGDPRHPLSLSRKELATLLRLVEAVFGPGWNHADGRVTVPGLLAHRRGRGSATDRLALLLLVLEARPDGRVRFAGGPVDSRYGRAVATLARRLGCRPPGAAKILDRLERAGVVQRRRKSTASGLNGAGELWVPSVARAWSALRSERQREPAVRVPSQPALLVAADPDAAAGTVDDCRCRMLPQPSVGETGPRTGLADPDGTAELHTPHTPRVPVQSESDAWSVVSGEADCMVPTDAGGTRADVSGTSSDHPATASPDAPDALRAENRPPTAPPTSSSANRRSEPIVHRRTYQALAPVRTLWQQLTPAQQTVAVRAVDGVLQSMRASDLAAHLTIRFAPMSTAQGFAAQVGDRGTIRSPLGWLLSQLPDTVACAGCGRTWHARPTGRREWCARCSAGTPASTATVPGSSVPASASTDQSHHGAVLRQTEPQASRPLVLSRFELASTDTGTPGVLDSQEPAPRAWTCSTRTCRRLLFGVAPASGLCAACERRQGSAHRGRDLKHHGGEDASDSGLVAATEAAIAVRSRFRSGRGMGEQTGNSTERTGA
ncbi:hypothetical protein ABH925_003546 [Streptacidiphilus sp. EB129]